MKVAIWEIIQEVELAERCRVPQRFQLLLFFFGRKGVKGSMCSSFYGDFFMIALPGGSSHEGKH